MNANGPTRNGVSPRYPKLTSILHDLSILSYLAVEILHVLLLLLLHMKINLVLSDELLLPFDTFALVHIIHK